MSCFSRSLGHEKLLGTAYVAAAFVALGSLVIHYYGHFGALDSGLMLGWDTSDNVRMATQVLSQGIFSSIITWNFPQLYAQLVAVVGSRVGNVALAEKVVPLFLSMLNIYLAYLLSLKTIPNVHVAGLSALIQGLSIGFLKLVSDNHRNLMGFTLALGAILAADRAWTGRRAAGYGILLVTLAGLLVATHFETFAVLSLTLILASFLTRNLKNVALALLAFFVPFSLLAIGLPSFFPAYFSSLGPANPEGVSGLSFSNLVYWMGGSYSSLFLALVGIVCSFVVWRKNRSLVCLLIFTWTALLLTVFVATAVKVVPLSAETGVRALTLIPFSLLIPLGVSLFTMSLWRLVPALSLRLRVWVESPKPGKIIRIMPVMVLIGMVVASSVFGVWQSRTYFNPFIPVTAYNKIVHAASYFRDRGLGVPVVVLNGQSVFFVSIYRSYFGSLLGEHFAYYGELENLLKLGITEPSSSDPDTSRLQSYFSETFFREMTGNLSGASRFLHQSYISDTSGLLSHPMILVTPELYDTHLPFYMNQFHIGNGIYVVPGKGLASPIQPTEAGNVTVSRDTSSIVMQGYYTSIDAYDPYSAFIIVNASSGHSEYNLTSYPPSWRFVEIRQGGDLSFLDYDPKRPNGEPAVVGNDYADSLDNWSQSTATSTVGLDTAVKKEGMASVKVQGASLDGNLALALSLPPTDFSAYSLLSFWTKCVSCDGMSLDLTSVGGTDELFRNLWIGRGPPGPEFKRFAVALDLPTKLSERFDIHAVSSLLFSVSSRPGDNVTLWIDDLVVQQQINQPSFLYKGRVLPTDSVEFHFTQQLPGSSPTISQTPVLSYRSGTDLSAFSTTTAVSIGALIVVRYKSKVTRIIGELRRRFSFLRQRRTNGRLDRASMDEDGSAS